MAVGDDVVEGVSGTVGKSVAAGGCDASGNGGIVGASTSEDYVGWSAESVD